MSVLQRPFHPHRFVFRLLSSLETSSQTMFSIPYRHLIAKATPQSVSKRTCLRLYSSSSSSKPSSPSDRPRNIATPAGTTKRKSGLSSGIEPSGTLAAGQDAQFSRLPVVPNTNHMHPAEVAASSFFALHRPLSIRYSIPLLYTASAFSTIFDSLDTTSTPAAGVRTSIKSSPFSDTPSQQPRTIERTIMGDLESLISSIRDNWLSGSSRQNALASPISNTNAANAAQEGEHANESTSFAGSPFEFSSRLFPSSINAHIPFHPPPVPVPRRSDPSATESSRPRRQLITILQTIYPNGMMMFTARSKEIAPITSPYMQRVRDRQREYLESWHQNAMEEAQQKDGATGGQETERQVRAEEMMAISVRRQRKLKMKKHKYKKLMTKTRNSRRRLEKQ